MERRIRRHPHSPTSPKTTLLPLVAFNALYDSGNSIPSPLAFRSDGNIVLRSGAGFFRMVDSAKQHDQFQREMDGVPEFRELNGDA